MKNPRIAFFITSTGWGGLEMNTVKLAKLLTERGYSIVLFTQQESTIYKKDVFDSTVLIEKKKKYFDFKAAKKIAISLKKMNISTIIVFDNKDIDALALVKRFYLKDIKIIYQQHMQIGINKKDFIHTFRFRSIDYWISPLQYLKDEVLKRTKYPIERVKIIPICLDTTKFTNQKYIKVDALRKLDITPKSLLIGIIGRISQKKGQLFIVESIIKLKQEGIQVELLIFGSATINDPECQQYYTNLLQTIKENNLENTVHFVDFQEDVSLFYNSIDLFVLASHSETYGMVTIEAMLSKLPIIATKSGGTPEILEYGKLGSLYEYENYIDFREKLIWHLNNKEESEKMASLAQDVAKIKYALENEIYEIDLLIQSL